MTGQYYQFIGAVDAFLREISIVPNSYTETQINAIRAAGDDLCDLVRSTLKSHIDALKAAHDALGGAADSVARTLPTQLGTPLQTGGSGSIQWTFPGDCIGQRLQAAIQSLGTIAQIKAVVGSDIANALGEILVAMNPSLNGGAHGRIPSWPYDMIGSPGLGSNGSSSSSFSSSSSSSPS